jgi:ribosomal protein S18 acetylase RimI-like enzyme
MPLSVRRLNSADVDLLGLLAREDDDFDLAGRGAARRALTREAAQAYLADAQVLHWVAEEAPTVLGHMQCHLLRKRAGDPVEVLLYEIGVRNAHRRKGVGRALLGALEEWMTAQQVSECWVLADNVGAVAFYRACGFEIATPAPTYLTRARPSRGVKP